MWKTAFKGGNLSFLACSCWGSHMSQALDPRLCCRWLSAPGRVALLSGQSWPWFEFVVSRTFAFFIISSQFSVACKIPQTKSGLLSMLNADWKATWRPGRGLFWLPSCLQMMQRCSLRAGPSAEAPPVLGGPGRTMCSAPSSLKRSKPSKEESDTLWLVSSTGLLWGSSC